MQSNFLKTIRDNWFLIVFFGSLIVSWTTYTTRVNVLESTVYDIKSQQSAITQGYQTLTNNVVQINAKLDVLTEFIKKLNISYVP